jgi:endogenous inhibitor of DNA gyrase (YacG/DUF329 family)
MQVKCPTCGKAGAWDRDNPSRPFCSERCKLIDLGAWFAQERAIGGESALDEPPAAVSALPERQH